MLVVVPVAIKVNSANIDNYNLVLIKKQQVLGYLTERALALKVYKQLVNVVFTDPRAKPV